MNKEIPHSGLSGCECDLCSEYRRYVEWKRKHEINKMNKRGMEEAARLRGHITKMEGWIRRMRCECAWRGVCYRCLALAECAQVDYKPNAESEGGTA